MQDAKATRLWILRGIAASLMVASAYIAWYSMSADRPRDFWQDKLKPQRANLLQFEGTFIDQEGKQVRLSDFANRNTISTFVFKDCGMSCPLIMNDLRLFHNDTPEFAKDGLFLIFTFEDHRANPEQLKDFLTRYHVTGNQWRVLTSDAETIRRLADTYALQYNKTIDGKLVYAHSNVFIVTDRKGRVTREFRGLDNNKARFFDEVKKSL
ncbi:SCO family protein [Turneriella parva]|uniref:Electron transport protein SCO1/SenC n=1 Tax=Turneriella parva (strain ATCC BAA-1111 / DSM 21527 / NCTC 11395 / H) TaxID=869212 RepID=I4B644_TURPD|nr:SCO family protein [Turneriella parva]AFM12751.1 electron transport protein SCO1/SenC [Turneriella parva DSM 21527]